MSSGAWVREHPAEITVCDPAGLILELNSGAETLFAEDGGRDLLGTNLLDCHPDKALGKLENMLEHQTKNTYFNTENGGKRFFFQSPWYKEGQYAGFVEISFTVAQDIPHFIRG